MVYHLCYINTHYYYFMFILVCSVMAVPNTMIYFTLYDQLKVVYGFQAGETNVWSPILSGSTARSRLHYTTCTVSTKPESNVPKSYVRPGIDCYINYNRYELSATWQLLYKPL